jgi:hypothetical protein
MQRNILIEHSATFYVKGSSINEVTYKGISNTTTKCKKVLFPTLPCVIYGRALKVLRGEQKTLQNFLSKFLESLINIKIGVDDILAAF